MREKRPDTPMIAVCSFSPGRGTVRRWSRFTERSGRAVNRIKNRQAMEDVTLIEGLSLDHAKLLARAGKLTFEALEATSAKDLAELGFDKAAVAAVEGWKREQAKAALAAAGDDLTSIPGVAKKTAELLASHNIHSFEDLRQLPDAALDQLGLAPKAIQGIREWRGGASKDEPKADGAKPTETKPKGPTETKPAGPTETKTSKEE